MDDHSASPLSVYVVELPIPEGGWDGIQSVAARARCASEREAARGGLVTFLRVVFVAEDESCFLLYRAPSAAAALEAAVEVMPVAQTVFEVARAEDEQTPVS
jgi:hypothetical protein